MIDTHCHIQADDYPLDMDEIIDEACMVDVNKLLLVGYDLDNSKAAIEAAKNRENIWASIGLHPHDADKRQQLKLLEEIVDRPKVVAIGECGLDYYYLNSSVAEQKQALVEQFEIAKQYNLPMIFHLRGEKEDSADVYDDFWKIYDSYKLPGVIHSFSAHQPQLDQALGRNLYVGVNGMVTFMKKGSQLEAIRKIPIGSLLTETDSPYLTPVPHRGQVNQPKYIVEVVKFLAKLFNLGNKEVAAKTEANAIKLFNL